jgi:hypothetical protein
MMKVWNMWTVLCLVGTISIPAAAQKAGFNGTWKLNLAKSFLAGDHPSTGYELTKVIKQKGGHITMTDVAVHVTMMNIPLPDSTTKLDIEVDGEEHDVQAPPPFPGMPPSTEKVSVVWQGCTLEIRERGPGFVGSSKRRYFLSEDGSELIVLVERHSTFQDAEQRLVFEKQP